MKRLLLSSVAAFGLATTAMAADLPEPTPPVEVAPAPVAPVFNWTGAYLGASLGGSFGNGKVTGVDFGTPYSSNPSTSGVIGGIFGGYNYQVTPNFVIGAEADISATSAEGKSSIYAAGMPSALNYRSSSSYLGTVRARAGVAFDRFLVYGTGGLAYGDQEVRLRDTVNGGTVKSTSNRVGWTLGAGVEGGITQNLLARVEYLYADLGSESYGNSYGAIGLSAKAKLNTNIVRAGIAYKF